MQQRPWFVGIGDIADHYELLVRKETGGNDAVDSVVSAADIDRLGLSLEMLQWRPTQTCNLPLRLVVDRALELRRPQPKFFKD